MRIALLHTGLASLLACAIAILLNANPLCVIAFADEQPSDVPSKGTLLEQRESDSVEGQQPDDHDALAPIPPKVQEEDRISEKEPNAVPPSDNVDADSEGVGGDIDPDTLLDEEEPDDLPNAGKDGNDGEVVEPQPNPSPEKDSEKQQPSVGEAAILKPATPEVETPENRVASEREKDDSKPQTNKSDQKKPVVNANASQGVVKTQSAPNSNKVLVTKKPSAPSSYVKVESGAYVIATTWGSALDIYSAETTNAANVQTWNNNYSAAQRFYIETAGRAKSGEWFYTIKNVNSGKLLDCEWGGKAQGTNVHQYASNGTAAQQWFLRKRIVDGRDVYNIVSLASGLVLDVEGCSRVNGSNVQIWRSNGTAAQNWLLRKCYAVVEDGAYVVVSALPGKRVIDVAGASPENGSSIQTYQSNGTLAQAFALTYDKKTGYYALTNYASGRVVDVAGGSAAQCAPIHQYAANGTKAQKWHVTKNANGSFTFVSAIGGKAIDISGGSSASGIQLQQYTRNNTKAQQFFLRKADPSFEGGVVMLRNGLNTYLVADVKGGSKKAGGALQLYVPNHTFAQKYQMVARKDGYFTIRTIGSGLYVTSTSSGKVSQQKAGLNYDYLWKLEPTKSGHFSLVSSKGGYALGVSNKASKEARLVGMPGSKASSSWNMLPVPLVADGLYTLSSLKNSGLVVEVANANLKRGANIRLWEKNGTNAQKFYVRHVGNGRYTIANAWSTLNVDVSAGAARAGANIQQYDRNGTKAQTWEIVWDGAGGFVFRSSLGSYSMGVPDKVGNGSNVALKAYDSTAPSQRFRLAGTTLKPLTMSDRIAILDTIAGSGLNVFKSFERLSSSTLGQVRRAIANYENNGKDVAFFVMDLNTGAGLSYGIDRKYYSASTIKGPYVAAVNKYYPWLLDSWSGTMYDTISVSSNEAYAYLRHSVGDRPLMNLIDETHAWDFNWRSDYVWYSTRDLAKLWVGTGDYLMSGKANAGWCRNVFGTNSAITSRPTLAWKGCPIYAKSGWVDGDITVHNEGCIVRDENNPYLMVVMSTQSHYEPWRMSTLMSALDKAHSDLV